MIHLAYPNVREGQFRACGRYCSFPPDQADQVAVQGYDRADPITSDLPKIYTAVGILVPERTEQVVHGGIAAEVYEHREGRGQGSSLDFAYLLALIRCSRPLRLEAVADVGDVWCTGEIGISGEHPELLPVRRLDFDAKLKGFLAQTRDRLFLVPANNFSPTHRNRCHTDQVQVYTLAEFYNKLPGILTAGVWPAPMVVPVDPNQLQALVAALFQAPPSLKSTPPPSPRDEQQQLLLTSVKDKLARRLASSLHHAEFINLHTEIHPREVTPFWDDEVIISHQQHLPHSPETEVIDVFDQEAVAGQLLILGAPGAGKSTMLLRLASALLARADADPDAPIPVLVNLSSWADDHQSLAHWLVAEVHSIYGVRQDIVQRCLEERRLVPLLDGLDEVAAIRLEPCVRAINQFQHTYRSMPLVVCCRLAEYQRSKTKLNLNGAVSLRPLTDEQIHRYLVNAHCPELWNSLKGDTALLDLVRAPLFLSMAIVAYEDGAGQAEPGSHAGYEQPQDLFERYIKRMLSRPTRPQRDDDTHTRSWLGRMFSRAPKPKPYDDAHTRSWLVWLAARLHTHARTELLLEQLQPTWLQSRSQEWAYHVGVGLVVIVSLGLLDGLRTWVMRFVPCGRLLAGTAAELAKTHQWMDGPPVGVGVGMIMLLIAGVIVGLRSKITPIETLRWSSAMARRGMALGLRLWSWAGFAYGSSVGLIIGLIGWSIFALSLPSGKPGSQGLASWSWAGLIVGVIAGLLAGGAAMLIRRPRGWGWNGLRHGRPLTGRSVDALLSGLLVGLSLGLGGGVLVGGLTGLSIGVLVGWSGGLSHRPAFRMMEALMVGLIGWLMQAGITWLIGRQLPIGLEITLGRWLDLWLYGWLGMATAAGLGAGLCARLRGPNTPVEASQEPEPAGWIWPALRWRAWLLMGGVAAMVSSLVVSVFMGLGERQTVAGLAFFSYSWGLGLLTVLGGSAVTTLVGAAMGAGVGAFFGAVFGALREGLTGPEIEERAVPNQGIRQSARNVGVFALVGGVTGGLLWGLLNIAGGVLLTGITPDIADWLCFGLTNMTFVGLLSALVPGAACLQHFTLRLVLWYQGVMPWRYVRFLEYATERRFLERFSGRYAFLHHLLRDHFAAMSSRARTPRP